MSSELKSRRSKKNVPPIRIAAAGLIRSTMDYKTAVENSTWVNERKLANKIMDYIRMHDLGYELDVLTRGLESCFMIAVLQQINRPEVFRHARPEVQMLAKCLDYIGLRKCVTNYVKIHLKAEHPKITGMKEHYIIDEVARRANGHRTLTCYKVQCCWSLKINKNEDKSK